MQLDKCSKKIDTLRDQKQGILGQFGDCVAESSLERNKPEVSEYNKEDDEMKGFDPYLLTGVLMEEKKRYAAALDHLVSERNVTGQNKRLSDQRDELNHEIQAKTSQRQQLIFQGLKEIVKVVRLSSPPEQNWMDNFSQLVFPRRS